MRNARTVAVLLFDGVNSVDVAGPAEAFASVRGSNGAPGYRLRSWSIGSRRVRSEAGLTFYADAAAPAAASGDLLIVPGGPGVRETNNLTRLADWLRRNHSGFARIAAVCTGAYALAEAGLLDGRAATTHWAHADDFRRRYPKVKLNADALFLKDGRFYSSGGVTAGIDLALDLIEADYGRRAAIDAARELVVFLRRTGAQTQFSAPLKMQSSASGDLADVCRWAAANLDADLSVEALAARAALSPRQFSRRFREAFGSPPAKYVRALKLDAARTALSEKAPIAVAAHVSGFKSPDVFRRAFERQFRVNPGEYQSRFAGRGDR